MGNIGLNAHTGDPDQGNPYDGEREKGIDYDNSECEFDVTCQEGNWPVVKKAYRSVANRLVGHLITKPRDHVLDLGSGTGISTLELLSQHPNIGFATGIEKSSGMIEVARYKFHLDSGEDLLKNVENRNLLNYWAEFRKDSKGFERKIRFEEGDIENLGYRGINHAIANQSLHWTDLGKTFSSLGKALKEGGDIVWNTCSHFYNDERFPSEEYGFRYNDFMRFVLDEVEGRQDISVKENYLELSRPQHNLESIRKITQDSGFSTEQVALYLLPVDFQGFVRTDAPVLIKNLVKTGLPEKDLDRLIRECIGETVKRPEALKDITHKYDTNPIFRSTKK